MRTRRMKQMVGVFFVMVGCLPMVFAGPDKAMFNATISVGWENHIRAGEWTPVEVMVSSQYEEPFIGSIEVSMAQDTQHRLVIHRPLVIQPAQTVRVPLVFSMSRSSEECRVRLIGRDGRSYLSQTFDLMNYNQGAVSVEVIDARQTLIAVTGKAGIAFGLDDINKEREKVVDCKVFTPMLPYAWVGYSGLDVLVLNDPDYSQMNLAQQQAMAQWISNGGKVLIIMGAKSFPTEGDLGRLIPFKIESPKTMTLVESKARQWKIEQSDGPVEIPGWVVDPKTISRDWRIAAKDQKGNPLIVEGKVGFGQIRLLTFDPQLLAWWSEDARKEFWLGQLGSLIDIEKIKKKDDEEKQKYYSYISVQDAGQNSIIGYLLKISGLRPIGIWTVLLVLGGMAMLIGPVDYMVLKKLNRLPWTYVTFLTILTVFTVGAYYGVQYWRAGDDQLRRITVIDKIDNTSCCWQTGFTSVFASKSDDFVMADQQPQSWWSGLGVGQDYWSRSRGGMLSNVVCLQQDGNIPVSMPINIWSVRTLLDQEPMQGNAFPLSAEIEFDGKEIKAKITNHSAEPIESGWVRVKAGWVRFSKIEPGQSVSVEGQPGDYQDGWVQPNDVPLENYRFHSGNVYEHWLVLSARGVLARTKGIEGRIEQGDAVIYAVSEEGDSCPIRFKDKSMKTTGKCYYRLVVPDVQNLQTGSQS